MASQLKRIFEKQNLEYLELVLKICAFLLGGYWTWYIFKYQYDILPSTEPTSLNMKNEIKKIHSHDSLDFYEVKISIQNKSNARIKIPASFYNIVAYRIKRATIPQSRFIPDSLDGHSVYLNNYFQADIASITIVHTDRILDDESFISPGGEFEMQHVFSIPSHRFDIIDINLSAISTKQGAEVFIKWNYNEIGKISATLYGIEKHWFQKNDTIPSNTEAFAPYLEKHDCYFTNVKSDYYIRERKE